MVELLRTLGTGAMIAGIVAFVLFLLLYLTGSDWRATPIGRYVAAFFGLIAIVLIYIAVITFLMPALPLTVRLIIRLWVFGSFATLGWWLVVILLRVQRRERHDRE